MTRSKRVLVLDTSDEPVHVIGSAEPPRRQVAKLGTPISPYDVTKAGKYYYYKVNFPDVRELAAVLGIDLNRLLGIVSPPAPAEPTKKLKAQWTLDADQDFSGRHGFLAWTSAKEFETELPGLDVKAGQLVCYLNGGYCPADSAPPGTPVYVVVRYDSETRRVILTRAGANDAPPRQKAKNSPEGLTLD